MLHHLAGATLQVTNLVASEDDNNRCIWQTQIPWRRYISKLLAKQQIQKCGIHWLLSDSLLCLNIQ